MDTAASLSAGSLAHSSPELPAAARAAQSLYGPVVAALGQVEERLRSELRSRYEELDPLLRHGVLLGGKRLRPALLLLSGAATGPIGEAHVVLGTVLEMIHTATLVHDDVLDRAEQRRHVPTVNARWDNPASVLLGDFLFAHSFYLAAGLGSTEACQAIGAAARHVCEGELRQVLRAGDPELTEATYLEVIEGKTAELTRVSCELGARASGADATQVDALARYGRAVGIAFQIADDYLDVWGEDDEIGKTLGSDAAQGKATLPVIRTLQVGDREVRTRLLRCLGDGTADAATIRQVLETTDARDYTRDRARFFVDEATAALATLPPSDSRACLSRIAEFAVERKF